MPASSAAVLVVPAGGAAGRRHCTQVTRRRRPSWPAIRVRRRVLLTYVVTGALVGLSAVFTIAKGTTTLGPEHRRRPGARGDRRRDHR